MRPEEVKRTEKKHMMPVYSRFDPVITRGKGAYVYDTEGRKYLDFLGGIATCTVGHANSMVCRAINEAAKSIINTTCLFYSEPQARLAAKLSSYYGGGMCFFSNSGAEANEAAIKLARKHTGRKEIISFRHGFHGRTLGSLAATGKENIKKQFRPMAPGFRQVPYNDAKALEKSVTKKTAAVIAEPIQGEAGITMPDRGFLKRVSEICRKKGALLIIDEVQSGMGRTGKFFAYQHEGIKPDMVTMAKGLANGVPIGVTIAGKNVSSSFACGDHGSTFGGNNLSCAAALAVIEFMEKNGLMKNAARQGDYFMKKLRRINPDRIREVRGRGLMIGIEMKEQCSETVNKLVSSGLLCVCTSDNVIRFLPPLMITRKDVDRALRIISNIVGKHNGKGA